MSVNLKKTKINDIPKKVPDAQDHKHSFKLDNMPLERSQNYLNETTTAGSFCKKKHYNWHLNQNVDEK